MSQYRDQYERQTGKAAPKRALKLEPLFAKIAAGESLPPRGQQAVDLGLTAHSLNDAKADPELYQYYQWVLTNYFAGQSLNELSAKLIGMAFTCANLFKTNLPQPITLNPWQIKKMTEFPLLNRQAVIIENNGVFALLLQRHPDWPLIDQAGNDFNPAYVKLVQQLEQRGVAFTYLGDLDSRGIQIADHLFGQLAQTKIADFAALQSPAQVFAWLNQYGKVDTQRTRSLTVAEPVFQQELKSINLVGKFVEQEQLMAVYEKLIGDWLKRS